MWYALFGFLAGILFSIGISILHQRVLRMQEQWISSMLLRVVGTKDATSLEVKQRLFPYHSAPDAMRALNKWFQRCNLNPVTVGLPITDTFMHETTISSLIVPRREEQYQPSPVECQSFDVGNDQTVDCPKHVVWFIDAADSKCILFWTSATERASSGFVSKLRIEVGYHSGTSAKEMADDILVSIEAAIQEGSTYRGKTISLEEQDPYGGEASGIKVHAIRHVVRNEVVLPDFTVNLLERNIIRFVEQRQHLTRLGMPVRKGVLFYGPPGTGKTHTIHYLIDALKDQTSLIVTAEQLGMLSEYMMLARLLQPTVVIVEDVDLIATSREDSSVCQQSLLNRLLNEMDGLSEDAAILFVLTTNRPEALEQALAARPGRVDQAIEFPLPDAMGRERLLRLYAGKVKIADEVIRETVSRTSGVSGAFIRELVRRALQFHLECQPDLQEPQLLWNDFDQAIDELLSSAGTLNRKLLGAEENGL